MAEFNELIRNFDKIRDYMRDFYIYGFKSRNDFKKKSTRTYDNEKRRIESYLGEYMKWDYSKSGKTAFISMDCSKISVNPLYVAWKSKAFTANDIMLHFYILDILNQYDELSIEELTDKICEQSEKTFEVQTVRNKCKEYIKNNLIIGTKKGKALYYKRSDASIKKLNHIGKGLMDAITFFQGIYPFGEIGSYIMDQENKQNNDFTFKHNYVAYTLENEVLFKLLYAIRTNQSVIITNYSNKSEKENEHIVIPLKIFTSQTTGRRFLCVYKEKTKRFFNYRLDQIKKVHYFENCQEIAKYQELLDKNMEKVWGVSFGGRSRNDLVCIKFLIYEKTEQFVLERIRREGHNGEIVQIDKNIFLYTIELFDTNDISPWIKTFIGRIIEIEGTNQVVIKRFYEDIDKMKEMYGD